jgi:hypothetical protein
MKTPQSAHVMPEIQTGFFSIQLKSFAVRIILLNAMSPIGYFVGSPTIIGQHKAVKEFGTSELFVHEDE